jgi:hypothetical protein
MDYKRYKRLTEEIAIEMYQSSVDSDGHGSLEITADALDRLGYHTKFGRVTAATVLYYMKHSQWGIRLLISTGNQKLLEV